MSSTSSAILGRHQILQPPPDQLLDLAAHQSGELRVGVANRFAVNQHRLVHPIAQRADRRGGSADTLGRGADARQQMIDRGDQHGQFGLIGLQLDCS